MSDKYLIAPALLEMLPEYERKQFRAMTEEDFLLYKDILEAYLKEQTVNLQITQEGEHSYTYTFSIDSARKLPKPSP